MKTCKADVTSARKKDGSYNLNDKGQRVRVKVGEVAYPEYDTFAELVTAEGEANVLKYSNAQIATNAKNQARAQAVGTVSETEWTKKAMLFITQPENISKLAALQQQAAGDQTLYATLFSNYTAEVVAQLKAQAGVTEEEES